MWENDVGTGLKEVQKRLGCEGCVFADQKARLKGDPCCTKCNFKGTGLAGDCLDRKPVRV